MLANLFELGLNTISKTFRKRQGFELISSYISFTQKAIGHLLTKDFSGFLERRF